jgi:hypothetical protein
LVAERWRPTRKEVIDMSRYLDGLSYSGLDSLWARFNCPPLAVKIARAEKRVELKERIDALMSCAEYLTRDSDIDAVLCEVYDLEKALALLN